MKQRFDVTGMSCTACSSHVERAVSALAGVSSVNVDLMQNRMLVDYDSAKLSEAEICAAVTAAGYGARPAGAAGGTVLTAATLGDKKAEQLIGVTLQKETDVLLILAKNDGKDAITEAILKKVGLKTDGGGVVFTLPVDSIAGVGGVGLHAQEKSAESADTAAEETAE